MQIKYAVLYNKFFTAIDFHRMLLLIFAEHLTINMQYSSNMNLGCYFHLLVFIMKEKRCFNKEAMIHSAKYSEVK